MSAKWLLAAAAFVLAVVAAVFLLNRKQPRAAQPQPVPAPAVTAPAPPPAPKEVRLTGTVQAANVVNVPATMDGTIEELMAGVGDVVIEGRVLARIRNPKLAAAEMMAQVEAERARNRTAELESALISARLEVSRSEAEAARTRLEFEKAEKEYQRQQTLYREGITARLTYEKSQQDYNALKADSERLAETAKNAFNRASTLTQDLENARRELEQKTAALNEAHAQNGAGDVRSPAAGIIVAKCCQAGDVVNPAAMELFQIASDLTTLQVAAAVDDAVGQQIHPGQSAEIEINPVPGSLTGKVREVQPGNVIIDFVSRSPAVRPGMTAQVRIKLS
jgi:HlyD family secretion protein